MKVFIAGGTGVLGRNVVRRLVRRGHGVQVLCRSTENERCVADLGAEPVAGDLFQMNSLARIVQGSEAVLHLATRIPNRIRPALRDFEENDRLRTEGTVKLLEAARLAGAKLYLQQSVAFIAATPDPRLLKDDDPCVLPADGTPLFAVTKMEELVRHADGKDSLRTMILRGGIFYHSESFQTRQLVEAIQRRWLPVFGPGGNIVSPIHVDDMATAFVSALDRPLPGRTFFVVDDNPLTFRRYVDTVARLVGAGPPRRLPEFLARPVLGPVMGILPKISFNCPNAEFKRATGWSPEYPDFESGMREVLGRLGLLP